MLFETIIIILIGTLLHFTYELSNHNKVVALFSAVNESTWEHIKIGLTATFIYSFVDGALLGTNENYFIAKFISLLCIIIIIPLLFYTYKSFTKKSILVVDIIIFCISIIVSQQCFKYILNLDKLPFYLSYLSVIGIFAIFAFYMVATLMPIKNEIFKDPISHKYGIKGHTEIDMHHHHH